jgi:tetratricopeptide (TPR) repeat protein
MAAKACIWEGPDVNAVEKLNLGDTIFLASGLYDDCHYEEALRLYQAADQAGAGYPAINGAGVCLNELEKPVEALKYFDRAYSLLRDEMLALSSNRAKALTEVGRCAEALQIYDGLMRSAPNDIFRYNRAITVMQMGHYDICIRECDDILSRDPDHDKARFARGFSYLVLGDYERGFHDYECRQKDQLNEPDVELWTGEQDLSGKTILVHAEMGLGDNIMFMRYVPLMVERGAKVICVLPDSQKFLIDGIPGVEWRNADHAAWPHLDYWVRFMSLAWCFKTVRETIPPPIKLMHRKRLDWLWLDDASRVRKGDLKVGLCWSGSLKSRYDQHRTIPLEKLAPLFDVPGVTFFSLQKDVRESDRDVFEQFPMIDLAPYLETFEDTSNAMKFLDLMITVDTSVAHMAGTVGIPTLVMLTSFRTYWLWITGEETSPWYPSVRTIRQHKDGDWSNVVSSVVERIQQLKIAA